MLFCGFLIPGAAFRPGDIGKIFEPFYTKKLMDRSGTGLGFLLFGVRSRITTAISTFTKMRAKVAYLVLYFPVSLDVPASAKEKIPLSKYTGLGERILVVDDVDGQRELALNMLERLGYGVAIVDGQDAAVSYITNHRVDLVVLDMIMDPLIDCLEAYSRILEINPDQNAIIASGFSENDRVQQVLALVAEAFIRKSYIMEKIGLAVSKKLESLKENNLHCATKYKKGKTTDSYRRSESKKLLNCALRHLLP